ncbi:MFS transporter [Mesoterricola silvestris]|nr:MFS transporter [Mesoterricola silvestris]
MLAAMDSTVVSTILPRMLVDLGGAGASAWLVSGFILAQTAAAPVFGRIADTTGIRAAFATAIAIFGAGSGWVGFARSLPMAILARALQGLGAGGILLLAYLLVAAYSDPQDRPKRQGLVSGVWGLAAILGPVAGTVAELTLGWRWVFLVNLPACACMLLLLWRHFPGGMRLRAPSALNPLDLLVLTAAVTLALLALSMAASGSPAGVATALGGVALILGGTLAIRFRKARSHPRGTLGPAILASGAAASVLYASATYLPQLIQNLQGHPVSAAGATVLAGSLGWVIGSMASGWMLVNQGYRRVALAGALLMTVSCAALGFAALGDRWLDLVLAEFLLGLGMGGVANSTLLVVQNHAALSDLGTMTAVVQLVRSLGAALGVNGLAAALAWAAQGASGSGAPLLQAHAYSLALFCLVPAAGIAAAASLRLPASYGKDQPQAGRKSDYQPAQPVEEP